MKLLYLLRHAKSSWDDEGIEDFDRPLNKRGRKAAKVMALHFRSSGIVPAIVLCSPAKRTRETLKVLIPALGDAPVILDRRIYEASYQALLSRLAEVPNDVPSILVIGHNPGIERLALFLMDESGHGPGAARLQDKYPTGSLAVLSTDLPRWNALRAGSCRLDDFVRPADLNAEE